MFKIFGALKNLVLVIIFAVLVIISSVFYGDNNEQKTDLENSSNWQKGREFIGFLFLSAEKLATLNFNKNIIVGDNLKVNDELKNDLLGKVAETDFKGIFNSVKKEAENGELLISSSLSESNSSWDNFFAKIKEEWEKEKTN
jgi:hypothetical protein